MVVETFKCKEVGVINKIVKLRRLYFFWVSQWWNFSGFLSRILIFWLFRDVSGLIMETNAWDQKVMQYDRWGSIIACIKVKAVLNGKQYLICWKVWRLALTVLPNFFMCLSNLNWESKTISRYLKSRTVFSSASLILNWKVSVVWSFLI